MSEVRVVLHDAAIAAIAFAPSTLDALVERSRPILAEAKARAPVSAHGSHGRPPGYLRSQVVMRTRRDRRGVVVDIVTGARAPDGFPYGAVQEARRHYLRASIPRQ